MKKMRKDKMMTSMGSLCILEMKKKFKMPMKISMKSTSVTWRRRINRIFNVLWVLFSLATITKNVREMKLKG